MKEVNKVINMQAEKENQPKTIIPPENEHTHKQTHVQGNALACACVSLCLYVLKT